MTKDILELERLDEYREGNQIEAKAAQGGVPDTLWDSYSAFANTDGGCVLLGVKEHDDHSLYVVGLKDAEKMKKDFWNAMNNRQKISVNLMTERRVRIENVDGKDIIVLEVPRAERTSRPVFKGMDPRKGTYRRNHEGDYLCSLEEVSAMFRDAALDSQDAKVLKEMDLSVFCQDSIRGYRQVFQNIHPNHTWNRLEDEVFLHRIGATATGEDGIFHVWNHVYHTPAEILEDVGIDRVTVMLPNGGHEQDVKAMLELYDHPEELTFSEEGVSEKVSENEENLDKLAIKQIIVDKLAAMRQKESKIGDNSTIPPKNGDKLPIRDEIVDKLADIVVFLNGTAESNSMVISQLIGKSKSTTKNYLTLLISLGLVEAHGANKNRSYSKK